MATIGNTDLTGWSGAYTVEYRYGGHLITMPEEGTVTSVTVRCWEDTASNAHNVAAFVYDSSFNLVDQGECRSNISTGESWVTFTGFSGATLSASSSYIIGIISGGGSGVVNIRSTTGSCKRIKGVDAVNFPDPCAGFTPDDPGAWLDDTSSLAIYLTYEPTSVPLLVDASVGTLSVTGAAADQVRTTRVGVDASTAAITLTGVAADAVLGTTGVVIEGTVGAVVLAGMEAEVNIQTEALPSDATLFLKGLGIGLISPTRERTISGAPASPVSIVLDGVPGTLSFSGINANAQVGPLPIKLPSGVGTGIFGSQYPRRIQLGKDVYTVRNHEEEQRLIRRFFGLLSGGIPVTNAPAPRISLIKRKAGAEAKSVVIKSNRGSF